MKITKETVAPFFAKGVYVGYVNGGVEVSDTFYNVDDKIPMIGDLMRCAASLGIDPSQIKDDSEYREGTDWGGMTGRESDSISFRVTFLYSAQPDQENE